MPSFIANYLEKGKKKKTRSLIYTGSFLLCIIIMCIMGNDIPAVIGSLMFISFLFTLFSWVTYLKYPMSYNNYKWFLRFANNEMLNEIDKVFKQYPKLMFLMGTEAIVDTVNVIIIIPYSQFARAYVEETQISYAKVVSSMTVYTKDGKKFTVPGVDKETFTELINEHVLPVAPDVIVGKKTLLGK